MYLHKQIIKEKKILNDQIFKDVCLLAQLVGNDCNFLNMVYNQHELFVIIRDRLLTVHVGVETLPLSLRIWK